MTSIRPQHDGASVERAKDEDQTSSPDNPFFALRSRAYQLADTGRFKRWDQVAFALQAEGFLATLINRLHYDKLAVMMITRCCTQAQSGA